MAARYSVYPPIPAAEYYSGLMQAYLDQLLIDLRPHLQQQRSQSTQDKPNQAANVVPVQQISPTSTTTVDISAPSTPSSSSYTDEEAVSTPDSEEEHESDTEEYPSTSLVVSLLAELGIYVSDDELII